MSRTRESFIVGFKDVNLYVGLLRAIFENSVEKKQWLISYELIHSSRNVPKSPNIATYKYKDDILKTWSLAGAID